MANTNHGNLERIVLPDSATRKESLDQALANLQIIDDMLSVDNEGNNKITTNHPITGKPLPERPTLSIFTRLSLSELNRQRREERDPKKREEILEAYVTRLQEIARIKRGIKTKLPNIKKLGDLLLEDMGLTRTYYERNAERIENLRKDVEDDILPAVVLDDIERNYQELATARVVSLTGRAQNSLRLRVEDEVAAIEVAAIPVVTQEEITQIDKIAEARTRIEQEARNPEYKIMINDREILIGDKSLTRDVIWLLLNYPDIDKEFMAAVIYANRLSDPKDDKARVLNSLVQAIFKAKEYLNRELGLTIGTFFPTEKKNTKATYRISRLGESVIVDESPAPVTQPQEREHTSRKQTSVVGEKLIIDGIEIEGLVGMQHKLLEILINLSSLEEPAQRDTVIALLYDKEIEEFKDNLNRALQSGSINQEEYNYRYNLEMQRFVNRFVAVKKKLDEKLSRYGYATVTFPGARDENHHLTPGSYAIGRIDSDTVLSDTEISDEETTIPEELNHDYEITQQEVEQAQGEETKGRDDYEIVEMQVPESSQLTKEEQVILKAVLEIAVKHSMIDYQLLLKELGPYIIATRMGGEHPGYKVRPYSEKEITDLFASAYNKFLRQKSNKMFAEKFDADQIRIVELMENFTKQYIWQRSERLGGRPLDKDEIMKVPDKIRSIILKRIREGIVTFCDQNQIPRAQLSTLSIRI